MGLALVTTLSLGLWLILWSLEVKAVDAFMIVVVIVLIGTMVRIAGRFVPGNEQKTGL